MKILRVVPAPEVRHDAWWVTYTDGGNKETRAIVACDEDEVRSKFCSEYEKLKEKSNGN